MSQKEYGIITQKVLTFLRTHPGEFFTAQDTCKQTGCTTTQARMALESLAQDGVIDKQQTVGGRDEYIYPKR